MAKIKCPKCASEDISEIFIEDYKSVIGSLIGNAIEGLLGRTAAEIAKAVSKPNDDNRTKKPNGFHCNHCNHTWIDGDECKNDNEDDNDDDWLLRMTPTFC